MDTATDWRIGSRMVLGACGGTAHRGLGGSNFACAWPVSFRRPSNPTWWTTSTD